MEQIPLVDDSELRLTIAEPQSAVRGGLIVLPEARGVTATVRRLADALAGEGWLVVVPHLYHRDGVDELPGDGPEGTAERIRAQVERLSAASVFTDTDAATEWLAEQGVTTDRIGVLGFGLGGTLALLVAAQRELGAAVTVGGVGVVQPVTPALPALVDAAPELRCPWLGIYGGDDPVSEDEVHKLRQAVDSAQVAADLVHLGDGAHRFPADRSTCAEAWNRTLNWFGSHLL
jgi:carboxymethylenebutenolidase